MKKFISILCVTALVFATAACSKKTPAPSAAGTPATGSASQSGAPAAAGANVLTGEIGGEITVSCFDPMTSKQLLDDAARAFEEKYPGTTVNVTAFSSMPEVKTMESEGKAMVVMMKEDNPQEKSDYISKINTELMSGQGPDILAIDILPYFRYAEGGQLEELEKYMDADPDFNIADYYKNVFDAVKLGGGQYIVPLDYSFNYFTYDSTIFSEEEQSELQNRDAHTYEELIDFGINTFEAANAGSSEPVRMLGTTESRLLDELILENYDKYINMDTKTVNLTDGDFAKLLSTVREYDEKGYLNPAFKRGDVSSMTMDAMQQSRVQQFLYKPQTSAQLFQLFNKNSNRVRYNISIAGGAMSGVDDELAGVARNANGDVPFTYSQAFGMNSNSSNKRTAWEFIKFLLSDDEVQTSMMLMHLPVKKGALEEKTTAMLLGSGLSGAPKGAFGATSSGVFTAKQGGASVPNPDAAPERNPGEAEPIELDDEQKEILRAYLEAVEKYSSMINVYNIRDETVSGIIASETANFFDGSKSADEVARLLQNRISLYLNE